ncbi:MAG: 23S rRNA (adenine(2503)-C(2))-methyltransferase RlmN [Chloroflexota bacterium]
MNTINLYDLTRAGVRDLLAGWGYSDYHAGRLWSYLYRQQVSDLAEMTELRPELGQRLAAETCLGSLATQREIQSGDGYTRKFLLELPDGQAIETVLMAFHGRATVCVSTQAGCAMGCVFCATGQMGFQRHLTPGEIVAQVLHVTRLLSLSSHKFPQFPGNSRNSKELEGQAISGGLLRNNLHQSAPSASHSLRNVVLMGMGEPLHNFEATRAAVQILTDDSGLAIAPRFITLSTVGLVPAIYRLADEGWPVRLAVSLHAATDEERAALVPIARKWPLSELMAACRYYVEKRQRRIFFEWALIAGQNDTPEQAHALGRLLHGLDAHVNLIPLNLTAGYEGRPSDPAAVRRFQSILAEYNLPSTVRQRRGLDIDAGCGQLRHGLTATDEQRISG